MKLKRSDQLTVVGIGVSIALAVTSLMFSLAQWRAERAYDVLKSAPYISIDFVDHNDEQFLGIVFHNAGQGLAIIERVVLMTTGGQIQPPTEAGWMRIFADLEIGGLKSLNMSIMSSGYTIPGASTSRIVGIRRDAITEQGRLEMRKLAAGIRFIICYSSIIGEKHVALSPGLKEINEATGNNNLCEIPYSTAS